MLVTVPCQLPPIHTVAISRLTLSRHELNGIMGRSVPHNPALKIISLVQATMCASPPEPPIVPQAQISHSPQTSFSPSTSLPFLLQLASPALPVGAYSYSEGLEYLVEQGIITTDQGLAEWIQHELSYGMMRIETAVLARTHQAMVAQDIETMCYWNRWLSAMRETKEIREQSWQMGQALVRLMRTLEPPLVPLLDTIGHPYTFATVFSITAAHWKIELEATLLGYLHSWITNLVNAGVKLIPLGQTAGQQLLIQLYPTLRHTVQHCLALSDDDLYGCNWGAAIASMNHETLYSRIFRS